MHGPSSSDSIRNIRRNDGPLRQAALYRKNRLKLGTSTPFRLILRSQRGEMRPDARRASAGIASPLSSSRNNAAGCFSPRPKGAPQTRPGGVTALGKRIRYSRRAVPCLGAFGGALRVKNKAKWGTSGPHSLPYSQSNG